MHCEENRGVMELLVSRAKNTPMQVFKIRGGTLEENGEPRVVIPRELREESGLQNF